MMKPLLALAALAGALWVLPAAAEPTSSKVVHVVPYGDLDLSTTAGRRALDSRIRVAVRSACGTASAADLVGKRDVRRCRDAALAGIAPVSERILTAAFERGPARPPTR